jgi:hypothetical protein
MAQTQTETGKTMGMSVDEQLDNFKSIYSMQGVNVEDEIHEGQDSEELEEIQNYCDGCGKSNWHSGLCWSCENEMI